MFIISHNFKRQHKFSDKIFTCFCLIFKWNEWVFVLTYGFSCALCVEIYENWISQLDVRSMNFSLLFLVRLKLFSFCCWVSWLFLLLLLSFDQLNKIKMKSRFMADTIKVHVWGDEYFRFLWKSVFGICWNSFVNFSKKKI